MKTRTFTIVLALLIAAAAPPTFAANKDMVALQTMVQNLQTQLQQLQQSIDERMGVMKNLVEQSADNVNKMATSVNNLQVTLDRQLQQQQQATGTKVDQISQQMQALNDSVDELKARLATTSKQLSDVIDKFNNIQAPAAQSAPAQQPMQQQQVQAPPPSDLYANALRDYNSGRYDLAAQEFGQFMKFYPTNDLAGNAQFYIADIEYQQKNYEAAVADYDKVLEQYPSGNKTPTAELKKGFALLELGQKDDGVRELQTLIKRYPRSIEAGQASDRLRHLNGSAAASAPRRRP